MRKESRSSANGESFFVVFAVLMLSICFTSVNTFGAEPEETKKEEGKKDGECTEGDCENGKGTKSFPDGTKYTGQFKDGKRKGQGTYTYSDGGNYTGEWEKGKRSGQGTYTLVGGDKYEGEWKDFLATGGWYYWPGGNKTWSYMGSNWEWIHKDSKP